MKSAADRASTAVAADDLPEPGSFATQSVASLETASQRPEPIPEFAAVGDIATLFGRSERTIRRWIGRGHLPALRVGRSIFIRGDDVAVLIADGIEATALRSVRSRQSPTSEPVPYVALGSTTKALNQ
jgi:excisionase family DNA binding protein